MVFVHMDIIPEELDFEDLTDKQVYCLAITHEESSMVFKTMEDFIHAFNCESGPIDSTWWGRVINFDDFKGLKLP